MEKKSKAVTIYSEEYIYIYKLYTDDALLADLRKLNKISISGGFLIQQKEKWTMEVLYSQL